MRCAGQLDPIRAPREKVYAVHKSGSGMSTHFLARPEESQHQRVSRVQSQDPQSLRILALRRLDAARDAAQGGRDDSLRQLCEALAPLLWRDTQRRYVLSCVEWAARLTPKQGQTLLAMASEVLAEDRRSKEDRERRARVRATLGTLSMGLGAARNGPVRLPS